MLYVTTASHLDAYTCSHALKRHRAADGGLYVPFRLKPFPREELAALAQKPFSENVCFLLRQLLGVELKSWDVDYAIGRKPVQLVALAHKIYAGETWRNLDWEFDRLVRNLSGKVLSREPQNVFISSWLQLAVGISVEFGLFALLQQQEAAPVVDVAMEEGDLSFLMSTLYSKKLGLPVGRIVCSCPENSPLWELRHTGRLQGYPQSPVWDGMERLIYEVLGPAAAVEFAACKGKNVPFVLTQEQKDTLRAEIFAVVVSKNRAGRIIPNVYRTSRYVLAPDSSLAYGGLLDYRSRTGERRPALLLTAKSPACDLETVASHMNLSPEALKELIFRK